MLQINATNEKRKKNYSVLMKYTSLIKLSIEILI